MATKKEKEELIATLKFVPVTVRMLIQGYGGECYAGRVERKVYDYFAQQRIDIEEYASDWDGVFGENVPAAMQPFSPGNPYDCNDLWHASGAEMSDLNEIRIDTDDGQEIWAHNCGFNNLEDAGVTVNEHGGEDLDDLDENQVVFWGGQGEKGCFFDAEFVLREPFDPKKLIIGYENCNGWYIINSVEYNGEELDGSGGYSTTGKWTEHKWILGGDESVYDCVALDDREDEGLEWDHQTGTDNPVDFPASPAPAYTVTDWYGKKIKPVHVGEYEVLIDAEWPLGGLSRAQWTGKKWKHNEEKVKIVQWRGVTEDLG
jgi:hypothetical protein